MKITPLPLAPLEKSLCALLFGALMSLGALADGLPPNVLKALKAAQIPAANVSVVVQPVDAATPLVAHNAAQSMNPASVMKLVTTYAALDLLGPAWTWKTTAWIENAAVDGNLSGNLYIKGSGDPRFAIEHLWSLLRQLRVRGIQHIAGDIVLDRTVFNVPSIDPGAFDDKPMRPYNVGPDGLLINFRALRFTLQPDNGKPRLLMETPSEGLRVDNQLRSGEGGCGSNWKDLINIRLIPENGGNRLEFTGTYSALCGEKPLNLSPLPADAQTSGLIRALWKELGGTLAGQVRSGNVAVGSQLIAQHESPPLADAVRDINKFSNNVMARQVFLTLGNDTAPATAERARQRIADWLNAARPALCRTGTRKRLRPVAPRADQRRQPQPPVARCLEKSGDAGIHFQHAHCRHRRHDEKAPERLRGHRPRPYQDRHAGWRQDRRRLRAGCSGAALCRHFLHQPPARQAGSAAIDALLVWVAQRRVGEKMPVLENE
jgi:D-alanyl-D-alanine carboxypeptidase/D-alanyl-D-alanine-endopeptidase (penicillin-binding protein 4)